MADGLTIRELVTKWGFTADKAAVDAFSAAVEKVKTETQKAEEQVKSLADSLIGVGKKLSLFVTTPLIGLATAGVWKAVEYEHIQTRFEIMLGDMTDEANAWIAWYQNTVAPLGKKAMMSGLTDVFAMMQSIMGPERRKEALAAAQQVFLLAENMASVMPGRSSSEVMSALQMALAGQTRGLKRLGIAITEEKIDEQLKKMGVAGKESAEDWQIAQATLNAVLAETTMYTGLAAKEADELPGRIDRIKVILGGLTRHIGEILTPSVTLLADKLGDLLEILTKLPEWVYYLAIGLGAVAATGGPLLVLAGTILKIRAALLAVTAAKMAAFWEVYLVLILIVVWLAVTVLLFEDFYGYFQGWDSAIGDIYKKTRDWYDSLGTGGKVLFWIVGIILVILNLWWILFAAAIYYFAYLASGIKDIAANWPKLLEYMKSDWDKATEGMGDSWTKMILRMKSSWADVYAGAVEHLLTPLSRALIKLIDIISPALAFAGFDIPDTRAMAESDFFYQEGAKAGAAGTNMVENLYLAGQRGNIDVTVNVHKVEDVEPAVAGAVTGAQTGINLEYQRADLTIPKSDKPGLSD